MTIILQQKEAKSLAPPLPGNLDLRFLVVGTDSGRIEVAVHIDLGAAEESIVQHASAGRFHNLAHAGGDDRFVGGPGNRRPKLAFRESKGPLHLPQRKWPGSGCRFFEQASPRRRGHRFRHRWRHRLPARGLRSLSSVPWYCNQPYRYSPPF